MKKLTVYGITIIFALFSFISCEEKIAPPKAGTAKANDMLSLIPKNATAFFFVDFQRIMAIEDVDKFIKEDENYEDYQEFVGETGIDPQNDIFFVAIAVTKGMEKPHQEGVGIINLKYNKDHLITMIKEKKEEEQELTEEEYNGVTIYTIKEEDGGKSFSFLDESNIVLGNENEVKSVIDVIQKKKENVFKNEELSAVLTKTNKDAMLWGAVLVPPEVSSKISAEKPMLSALEAVNSVAIYFDYKDKNIIAEIKLMSSDPMKNQELADNLNGYKTMAALIQIQDLNMAEILDRIEITSFPDHVKIYTSFPEDLPQTIIDKLKMEKTKEEKKDI